MLRADAHLGDILVAEVVNGVLVGEHHTTNRLVAFVRGVGFGVSKNCRRGVAEQLDASRALGLSKFVRPLSAGSG
jgi:hypothetical protein